VRRRRYCTLAAAGVLALYLTGCLGIGDGSGKWAKYQHRDAARAQIDKLLATLPVYPGARAGERDFAGSGYYVGKNYEKIEAEPYALGVDYAVNAGLSGAAIMRFFRRALPAQGWRCMFTARVPGVLRSFQCKRGHQAIGAQISDTRGYGLQVVASNVVPPIKQVPQVE
jgi:hypothetical protein